LSVIETIKQIDTQLFLWLNTKHNSFFDFVMYWLSNKWVWIPFYAMLLYILIKQYGKKAIGILITITVSIILSDQISTQLFKKNFLRYRPCHNLNLQTIMHLNGDCGGMYGFVSSHAANSFALASLLFFFLFTTNKKLGYLLFIWAMLVSYSRIYNGVHYPADIVGGMLVGITVAVFLHKTYQLYLYKTKW
jgi:undecaprenyl-diphosphatase